MDYSIPPGFKAYDIRGRVPDELNQEMAYDIGRAFKAVCRVTKVVVGHDMRLTSEDLTDALSKGLSESGVEVLQMGLCGTEEIYHAAFSLENQGVDGGIIVTASHNPADFNGMKFVVKGARPVSGPSGLYQMGDLIIKKNLPEKAAVHGRISALNHQEEYIKHLLSYIEPEQIKPFKLVVNSGNGCAGKIIDLLAERLNLEFIRMHHQPDGNFPNGVPNPLLPENRQETSDKLLETGADMALAWDGDFDRCFFWDEQGNFIEGYYIVALLAEEMLRLHPGSRIIHDPRLIWCTREAVANSGGEPVICRTGHAFIKEKMREVNAVYGGEMSAHHYFREFSYCDSGMIPWLLICSLMSRKGKPLSELAAEKIAAYPISGEINNRVKNPDQVIDNIYQKYGHGHIDRTDGLSISFDDYRFNIRKSNTEPLLRLNVESKGDKALVREKTDELLSCIKAED
ncbi:MAG: phosphomannomutase [Deltaproteobacteria bacterium]|nr:MAG: phosphomannomutase [Deltaproteobacteria bacterium]